jgi:hypothetical protein
MMEEAEDEDIEMRARARDRSASRRIHYNNGAWCVRGVCGRRGVTIVSGRRSRGLGGTRAGRLRRKGTGGSTERGSPIKKAREKAGWENKKDLRTLSALDAEYIDGVLLHDPLEKRRVIKKAVFFELYYCYLL